MQVKCVVNFYKRHIIDLLSNTHPHRTPHRLFIRLIFLSLMMPILHLVLNGALYIYEQFCFKMREPLIMSGCSFCDFKIQKRAKERIRVIFFYCCIWVRAEEILKPRARLCIIV